MSEAPGGRLCAPGVACSGGRYDDACRGEPCRRAHAERKTEQRHTYYDRRELIEGRLVAPLPPESHGLYSSYTNHGCRCEDCSETNKQRKAEARRG